MNTEHLKIEFQQRFGEGKNNCALFFAPGRINIIGEHLDYNGGFVLPCALSMGTWLVVRKRDDRLVKLASQNFDSSIEISLNEIHEKRGNSWWNYPLGVIHEFSIVTQIDCGFEMMFGGDLPVGVGLSSSSSIEITAFAMNNLFQTGLSLKEIVLLSRRAENNFVGVQCGIMDQYAVALGKKDHALFLNCLTAEHEYIPAEIDDYSFIISNTNKPRQLESSAFNERFHECQLALKTMQRLLTVNEIAEATPDQFEMIEHWFPDENTRKRAHHLVFENNRVKKARKALSSDDVFELATLMNESHASLRDNYEVSCDELETIVNAARLVDGCLASRISGAGFGGCTISLIRRDARGKFCDEVKRSFQKSTGLTAEFYDVEIGNGVREYK